MPSEAGLIDATQSLYIILLNLNPMTIHTAYKQQQ
jgi:hypothetical protein